MISLETLALAVNIAVACVVGFGALRKSTTPGASGLFILAVCAGLFSACYLLYDTPTYRSQRMLWAAGIYLTATTAASAMFIAALAQSDKRAWLNLRTLGLLAVMPVLTQILFWTTAWRGLFFQLQNSPAIDSVLLAGRWGRLNAAYILVLTAAGVMLSLEAWLQKRRAFLNPVGPSVLSAAVPILILALDFAGWTPISNLELLPFAFTLAGLGYLQGAFRRQHSVLAPVNREAVVEGMDEGWMVLDASNTIVDMNAAAERMTGLARGEVRGRHVSSVLGDVPHLGQTIDSSQELEMKRSIRSEEGWRYLNIRLSPLTDPERGAFGRLAVWRDMTDRKRTEDSRQRARDEMFALLNAISSAASNTLSMDDFLLESIYHIISPFRSQAVAIFLMDDRQKKNEEPRLFLASYLGLPAASAEALSYVPTSSPLFDWVVKNRQPFLVEDAGDDARVPAAIRKTSIACFLVVPLLVQAGEDSRLLGCMCLARREKPTFSPDEIVRLATISEHMANLIDSDRRRRTAITMTERQKLMRDLHDSVSQKLYGVVTTTEAAQASLETGAAVDPAQEFARIGENARQAVREMRLFLYQMQHVDIEKEGLISVLHHRLSAVEGRSNIQARLLAEDEGISLSKDKEMMLYYIAMEALNNIVRHAHATSVLVTLKQGRQNVIMEIRDDGCGFDVDDVDRAGLGLQSIRERTAQINGKLKIVSKPKHGTKIVVSVRKDPMMSALTTG